MTEVALKVTCQGGMRRDVITEACEPSRVMDKDGSLDQTGRREMDESCKEVTWNKTGDVIFVILVTRRGGIRRDMITEVYEA